MLAMHMANELLTPVVALLFMVVSAGVLMLASARVGASFEQDRIPLMGVLGAFVFAAQMINFPILPGTSGHFGGGVLLAILLGPHAATLVMTSILIVQCLIFQDGGLLALGTNVFNLGIVPAYLGYALFRLMAGLRPSGGRLYASVFVATLVGMVAGAAMVPIEVRLSGLFVAPMHKFLLAMIGLHLLVGLGEAIITFLVIGYVVRVRPGLLGPVADRVSAATGKIGLKGVLASFFVVALLLGGVVAHWASEAPDALESITAAEGHQPAMVAANENETISRATAWQERTALLPDYRWTSLSGIAGTALTLAMVWLVGRGLARRRKEAQGVASRE
ncbi:MAG TPA: energy-coupling factor ABC transporter permease [Phycisphaerae bacterium]|nr:energy-coupling factor ABC transporter permease [Phycisphaerae bacterium]HRY68797.1 energy-coupling factor ABC transporter permease [Phycisphaerae bacterium]